MDKVPPPVKGVVIRETKVPEKHQQNIMLRNVGMTDRILRGVIGLAFIPAAVVSRKITPCVIASLFIASGGMGYHAFHLNTLPKQNKEKEE